MVSAVPAANAAATEGKNLLDQAASDWLSVHDLAPPTNPAEARARALHGEEADITMGAETSAWRACDLLLAAQPLADQDIFDETLLDRASIANTVRRRIHAAARQQLIEMGVCTEHLGLPADDFVPMLHEMAFARHVGASALARRRMPTSSSFGAAHRWPRAQVGKIIPPDPDSSVAVVVIAHERGDDVGWVARLPPRVKYELVELAGSETASQGAKAADCVVHDSHPRPCVPFSRRSTSAAFLGYLATAAANEELAELLKDPIEAEKRVLVVSHETKDADDSVQHKIIGALRRKAERVLDLFKKWDADNSGTVDRTEFRKALRVLKIPGTNAEIDMLFDMWDADGGGSIEYTEILKAVHSGRRFDRLQKRKAGPPLPPLVVCAPANPFESNPRFLEELGLLVRAAASGRPLPKFVPLGKSKTNETLVHSDPSGAPHANGAMLPVGMVWRGAFGDRRVLPLWLGHTPGALFAVSRDAVMEPWRAQSTEAASAFYRRALVDCALLPTGGVGAASDPVSGHAFERLWRYVFVDETEEAQAVKQAVESERASEILFGPQREELLSDYALNVRLGRRL